MKVRRCLFALLVSAGLLLTEGPSAADSRQMEVLQLFNFAEKSPAFAILLKSSPLILRHLNKAVFGKTGNFQQNQIFATLPFEK
jgi:hypothetical protein